MRTPTIPWNLEKEKMLDFKARGFSYKQIGEYLFSSYGHCVTQARLSQIFKQWKNESQYTEVTYPIEGADRSPQMVAILKKSMEIV